MRHGVILLLLLVGSWSASAQTPAETANQSLRLHFIVRPVLSISVDPEVIDFGEVPVEASTSFRSPIPLSIRIRANGPWSLNASIVPIGRTSAASARNPSVTPRVRFQNLPGAGAALLTEGQTARPTILSGGSTGPDGLVLHPDVIVDVPPGTTPGTYRLTVIVELRGAP